MRIGIYAIDSKMERMGHGKTEQFPNIAAAKIYGYHWLKGDEIIPFWSPKQGNEVDLLYVSAIFSWSRPAIQRQLPLWRRYAKEIILGGTGWDWDEPDRRLPPESDGMSQRWAQEMYRINYGIGQLYTGCHVGCPFCVVPRKEGVTYTRQSGLADLLLPGNQHLVLLDNNPSGSPMFFEATEEIIERGLTVNFNQADDLTQITPAHTAVYRRIKYRNFNATKPMLHFAWDLRQKPMRDRETGKPLLDSQGKIRHYDMDVEVPRFVRMMAEEGIPPHHLTFYVLIGYNTTLEYDLHRIRTLHALGCHVYVMVFRDLRGRVGVDAQGLPQGPWVKPLRDWVNGHGFRTVPFEEFDRWTRRQNQLDLSVLSRQAAITDR